MTAHHHKHRFITSRFVLVMAVVIASFLAAFLGQVLITQLSLSPSVLPQPGIIVRSSAPDATALRARAESIINREGSSFVTLFEAKDPLSSTQDGWVMSSDGWIVYLNQPDFTPTLVRLDSGATETIIETIVDPASALRFVKINQDRLTPVTLAQQAALEPLDTLLSFTNNGLYSTTQVVGSTSQLSTTVLSSDRLSHTPQVIAATVIGSALYNNNNDFVGLALIEKGESVNAVIPAEYIRSRLLEVLRSGNIEAAGMQALYIDLGVYPTSAVTETAGAWIPTQTYSPQPVLPVSGAAYKAGLRIGDVITAVDGVPLSDRFTLSESVLRAHAGDSLELTVSRRGTPLTITVDLQAAQ